jgi:hypothetical protein
MGLSEDQRAMLRLLAQREQGYEDIAALMGLSVEEVRAKVAAALTQLEDEGVAPPALPPEPPAPVPESPAPEPPAPEPEPPATPEPPPPASTPEPPAPPSPEPAATARPAEEPKPAAASQPSSRPPASDRPKLSLPTDRGPRAAIAAGAAVVIALIVVVIVSGGGGGGSSSPSVTTTAVPTSTGEETTEAQGTAASTKQVTKAVLTPVAGGNASGVAIFGRVKESLALQVEAWNRPRAAPPTRSGWRSRRSGCCRSPPLR